VTDDIDPDASFIEDQHFDFTPGDEAELETSGEVIQRLEHEKHELENQVSEYHSKNNQQQADLESKANIIDTLRKNLAKGKVELGEVIAKKTKSKLEAGELRIALEQVSDSLSKQTVAADNLLADKARLEDSLSKQIAALDRLSVEKAKIQDDLSKQTAAVETLSMDNARLEAEHRIELQRVSDDLSRQTEAAKTLSTEKSQLEIRHQLEVAQLTDDLSRQTVRINKLSAEKTVIEKQHQGIVDQAQVRIAEMVSDHYAKINVSAERLGAEIVKHQSTSDTLDETRSLLLGSIRSHALEKFFWVHEDGDALSFTKRAAAKLTKHLAPLHGEKGVFNAVKYGVVARARSALPASTILPLIHTLGHLLTDAQSIHNGLSVEQWTEIRNLGIEAFQVKFVDDVSHSLHARALTIQASTIAKGIKEMIPPMNGMADIHKVLQGPVEIILSRAMRVDNKEFPLLNKKVLAQRIEGTSINASRC
jgi:small-conductance mechanosensitive channel